MSILKKIHLAVYCVFGTIACAFSYIYVTAGLGGDLFLGICGSTVSGIMLYIGHCIYHLFKDEFLPVVSRQLHSRRIRRIKDEAVKEREKQRQAKAMQEKAAAEEKRKQVELDRETVRQYTIDSFSQFMDKEDVNTMLAILDEYVHSGRYEEKCGTLMQKPLYAFPGMTVADLKKYIWSVGKVLGCKQLKETVKFYMNAMPNIFEGISFETIYRKLKEDGKSTIDYMIQDE